MDVFLKIVQFLKMPAKLVFLLAIIFAILLFSPSYLVKQLQLQDFMSKYGTYVGVLFLFCVGYVIITWIPALYLRWKKTKLEK